MVRYYKWRPFMLGDMACGPRSHRSLGVTLALPPSTIYLLYHYIQSFLLYSVVVNLLKNLAWQLQNEANYISVNHHGPTMLFSSSYLYICDLIRLTVNKWLGRKSFMSYVEEMMLLSPAAWFGQVSLPAAIGRFAGDQRIMSSTQDIIL